MAEILISLTIIGVIAAITLPTLRANINEGVWNTQRKALYSRLSQAISMLPSLNGYGAYSGTWADDVVTPTEDTAAATFVTDGLAKVLQINNICSIPMGTPAANARKELAKCGVPSKITTMKDWTTGKTSKIDFPTKLSELNPMFTSRNGVYVNPLKNIDTIVAAFETKNNESVALFYNPYCMAMPDDMDWQHVEPRMCANFIYDLNGKKGPNKVGKDIGFITAMYPVDSVIVAPMPFEKDSDVNPGTGFNHYTVLAACKKNNGRIPNLEEYSSLFYNQKLIALTADMYFTNNNDGHYYYFYTKRGVVHSTTNPYGSVRCIKR